MGDGAEWTTLQFGEQFGGRGRSLVDFWHVGEYLGAAARVVHPQKAREWRRRQQGRLLENKVDAVLRALAPHLEPETQEEAPVRAAHRCFERAADATGLRRRPRRRPVIQQRLKLAGGWWKETTAEAMLGLRVARANQLWDSYWKPPRHTPN